MTTEETADENTKQDHIGVVAEMINQCLTADGWDIGVIEDIAGYCKNLGLAIWEVEDVDFEEEEEVKTFPIFSEEMLESARERSDEYTKRFIDAFETNQNNTYQWEISISCSNETANQTLTETLARCLPHLYDTTYTARMTPCSNTFSYDNEPF